MLEGKLEALAMPDKATYTLCPCVGLSITPDTSRLRSHSHGAAQHVRHVTLTRYLASSLLHGHGPARRVSTQPKNHAHTDHPPTYMLRLNNDNLRLRDIRHRRRLRHVARLQMDTSATKQQDSAPPLTA